MDYRCERSRKSQIHPIKITTDPEKVIAEAEVAGVRGVIAGPITNSGTIEIRSKGLESGKTLAFPVEN
jgi:hypothetical protein